MASLPHIQFKLTYVSQIHVITEVVVEDTDIDDSGATAFQDTMEDCAKVRIHRNSITPIQKPHVRNRRSQQFALQ